MMRAESSCTRISWQTVSAVADDVAASGIAGGVRGKEEVCALQFMYLTFSTSHCQQARFRGQAQAVLPHGDLILPNALGLWGHKV